MRLLLTCECVCISQVDSELTSFVTALSEVSSLTDPTYYSPDSKDAGSGESLTWTFSPEGPSGLGEADLAASGIAFVVDRNLKVLLWSNGLAEATNLTKDTVEGRDISLLPFLSEDNRDNTTAAIRQLFLHETEAGSTRRMLVALEVSGARTEAAAASEILLQFTAAFCEDMQHVVCVGLKLGGRTLSGVLQDGHQDASEAVPQLTSETNTGIAQPLATPMAESVSTRPMSTAFLTPGLT